MAEELNAGNLFVEIGAKTAKLDAELKKAQAELDALERSDPLVDVMVEIEDARQIEQELDRKIAQIDAQPIDVEVNIDKPNNIGGAGKQIELFQQQLSKVLGIAAGITAGVALSAVLRRVRERRRSRPASSPTRRRRHKERSGPSRRTSPSSVNSASHSKTSRSRSARSKTEHGRPRSQPPNSTNPSVWRLRDVLSQDSGKTSTSSSKK